MSRVTPGLRLNTSVKVTAGERIHLQLWDGTMKHVSLPT